MDNETSFMVCEGIVVPESALLKREHSNKYGSVPGLDDSELLDDKELEWLVFRQEFEPLLTLPVKPRKSWIKPSVDEDGRLDWGAFGTVDFQRLYPFDKAKYKADKLREQLKDLLIRFGTVNDRIKVRAKYLVLKYLRKGIIGVEHIVDSDVLILARLHLRIMKMQKQIRELIESSRRRNERRTKAFLAAL